MRSKSRLKRMVGGVASVHGMWPWQAGLYRLEKTTGKFTSCMVPDSYLFLLKPRVLKSHLNRARFL